MTGLLGEYFCRTGCCGQRRSEADAGNSRRSAGRTGVGGQPPASLRGHSAAESAAAHGEQRVVRELRQRLFVLGRKGLGARRDLSGPGRMEGAEREGPPFQLHWLLPDRKGWRSRGEIPAGALSPYWGFVSGEHCASSCSPFAAMHNSLWISLI